MDDNNKERTFKSLKGLKALAKEERNKLIKELKVHWGVDKFQFIAQVRQFKNGFQQLMDLRKENGDRILDPNGKSVSIAVPPNTNLDPNEEYLIEARLAPDAKRNAGAKKYLLYLDTSNQAPKKYSLPTKSYVDKLRQQYESAQGIAKATLIGSLRRLSAETNKKPETFIYELIQNADDYPDPSKKGVQVSFHITKNHLVLTHDGLPFKQKNVYAICTVDAGDKKSDINKTGFKGIGFKSIFKFSNHVWINSGGYSFKFDEYFYKNKGQEMPWQVIPIWTMPAPIDPETQSYLDEPVTIFIRPNEGVTKLQEITDVFYKVFRKNDRLLLFLRNVQSIVFKGAYSSFRIQKDTVNWEISHLDPIGISEDVRDKLSKAADRDDRVPEKYRDLEETTLTFASLRKNGKIKETPDAQLYAYLPTDWNFGFKFLINGDFIPDGSRDRLFDDIEWNLYLFEQVGYQLVEWLIRLQLDYKNHSPLIIFPNIPWLLNNEKDRSKHIFLERMQSGLQKALEELEFLPTTIGKLVKLKSCIYDETIVNQILPNEIMSKLVEGKAILHGEAAKINAIRGLLYNEDNSVFTWDDLKKGLEDVRSWLEVPTNSAAFINHLVESSQIDEFQDCEVLLDQNGELRGITEVYKEIPKEDLSLLSFLNLSAIHPDVKKKLSNLDALPLLAYSGKDFIEDYILKNKSDIDTKLEEFDTSVSFYSYLAKYQGELSETTINELDWFHYFTRDKELRKSVADDNVFFKSDLLEDLLKYESLPPDQIQRLPDEYLDAEGAEDLWLKLGAQRLANDTIGEFYITEVKESLSDLNVHLEKLFNQDVDKYLSAVVQLLSTYFHQKRHINEEDRDKIESGLSTLRILTSDNSLEPIEKCYIASVYTGKEDIEDLIHQFPEVDFSFISKEFLAKGDLSQKDWKSLFTDLGANTSHVIFLRESLIPQFDQINKENIISATRLLFDNRKNLEADIENLEAFWVLTRNGIQEVDEAVIGSHYLPEGPLKQLMSYVELPEEIDVGYSEKKLEEWRAFFVDLGVPEVDEEDLIAKSIDYIIENPDRESITEDHFNIIEALVNLEDSNSLSREHYNKLWSLQLLSNDKDTLHPAQNLILNKAYRPKIAFEDFLPPAELHTVSTRYQDKTENKEVLKSFFVKIGISESFRYVKNEKANREDIPDPYLAWLDARHPEIPEDSDNYLSHSIEPWITVPHIDLILNPEINKFFWNKVEESKSFRQNVFSLSYYNLTRRSLNNLENEPTWFIMTNKTGPTCAGTLELPTKLYDLQFRDAIEDDTLICSLSLDDLEADGQWSVAGIIEVKTKLDLEACLSALKRQKTINWLKKHGILTRLSAIFEEELSDEETELLNQFIEKEKLPNELDKWSPIKNLYYVEEGFNLGITKSKWIIHPDLNRFSQFFQLNGLKESDFKFESVDPVKIMALYHRLADRAKFLAYVMAQVQWEERRDELANLIKELVFYSCRKIAMTFTKEGVTIQKSDYSFYLKEDNQFYFIGNWDSISVGQMIPELYKKLELGLPLSAKVFIDILLAPDEKAIVHYLLEYGFDPPGELSSAVEIIKRENEPAQSPETPTPQPKPPKDPDRPEPAEDTEKEDDASKGPIDDSEEKEPTETETEDKTKRQSITYTEEEEQLIRSLFGDDLTDDEKSNENLAAHIKGMQYLKSNGFNVEEAQENFRENFEDKRYLDPVRRDDTSYTIMCRSARRGLLYLSATAWLNLMEEDVKLYILLSNDYSDCKLVDDAKEFMDSDAKYWIIRHDSDKDITPLSTIAKNNPESEFLFEVKPTEYRGIFHGWGDKKKGDGPDYMTGNEDDI